MTNLLNKGLREPDYSLIWDDYYYDEQSGEEEYIVFDKSNVEFLLDDDCKVSGTHTIWGNWSLWHRWQQKETREYFSRHNQLS